MSFHSQALPPLLTQFFLVDTFMCSPAGHVERSVSIIVPDIRITVSYSHQISYHIQMTITAVIEKQTLVVLYTVFTNTDMHVSSGEGKTLYLLIVHVHKSGSSSMCIQGVSMMMYNKTTYHSTQLSVTCMSKIIRVQEENSTQAHCRYNICRRTPHGTGVEKAGETSEAPANAWETWHSLSWTFERKCHVSHALWTCPLPLLLDNSTMFIWGYWKWACPQCTCVHTHEIVCITHNRFGYRTKLPKLITEEGSQDKVWEKLHHNLQPGI